MSKPPELAFRSRFTAANGAVRDTTYTGTGAVQGLLQILRARAKSKGLPILWPRGKELKVVTKDGATWEFFTNYDINVDRAGGLSATRPEGSCGCMNRSHI